MICPETAEVERSPVPVRVPGVASTAIHGLLTGMGAEATVLGSSSQAAWLQAGRRVVVISTGDGARLPNSIRLAAKYGDEVLRRIASETRVLVGHGMIMVDGIAVTATRWWDPRPALPTFTSDTLTARLRGLPTGVPGIDTASLRLALEVGSAGGVLHSARSLLGRGPGLTPEGDDVLAGTLAATRLLGEALGRENSVAMIAGVSPPLAELAALRTTAFSAALIEMAMQGQVVESAGVLLRALAGRGDVAAAHLGLIRLGHTSGPALAAGIVLGARSLVK